MDLAAVIAVLEERRKVYIAKRNAQDAFDDDDSTRWEVYDFAVEAMDYAIADVQKLTPPETPS